MFPSTNENAVICLCFTTFIKVFVSSVMRSECNAILPAPLTENTTSLTPFVNEFLYLPKLLGTNVVAIFDILFVPLFRLAWLGLRCDV